MKKKLSELVLFFVGIIFMLSAIVLNYNNTFSLSEIVERTSLKLQAKSEIAQAALLKLGKKSTFNKGKESIQLFEAEKIGLYLYENDSLIFWNNSQIPLEKNLKSFENANGVVKLKHGIYLYVKNNNKDGTIAIAICLIKPLYEIQNKYLKNEFVDWIAIPNELSINFNNLSSDSVLLNQKKVFSLSGNDLTFYDKASSNFCFIIFFFGFLVFLIAILKIVRTKASLFISVCLLLVPFGLKIVMLYFEWPSFFYRSLLYDVRIFGDAQSTFNAYLGDILFNAILVLFSAVALHFILEQSLLRKKAKTIDLVILFGLSFLILNQFNSTLVSLVSNSTLNFDLLSIFNIEIPAFVGLGILGIYSIAAFVVMHKIINYFEKNTWIDFFVFALINLVVCFINSIISNSSHNLESYWLFAFAVVLFVLVKLNFAKISLGLGFQILIMSVITSVFLNFYVTKNQNLEMDLLSLRLSERQDATLESEFVALPSKIEEDESLNNLISILPNSEKEIEQLLKQKFFDGYFNRYNVDFSLFDSNCKPLLQPKQGVMFNEGFFEDQIKYNSDSTFAEGLFFVKKYKENVRYISKVKLKDKILYVLLEPKQVEELGSFPDLLLDQSQQKQEKLKNMSYAIYRRGEKVSQFGGFNFPFSITDSSALSKSNPGFTLHYLIPDEATEIIISQNNKTWTNKFTYNSYLFLFFSVISYSCYFVYALLFTKNFKNPSLTRRIQTIIIVLLLLAMSAVGITSGRLVINQFEVDNKKQLREKTDIVVNELISEFKTNQLFDDAQKELVNLKLKEYARLFNTDISLFDKSGLLFNTSQIKLYELGLSSTVVNPTAFWNLKSNESSAENVNEIAGTLKFSSRYTPLFDSEKQLLGFINLPYFSRQSDVVNELSGIISALINVYVILFVISILSGLILSGYITQPLRLIKQQISNISLGKQNEKITWQSNDEIGKLVAEYNQMLVKLEESASLLAQSERESAWREMAKQVAHEIKNPLTPMKLNLQYLQHLMKNNADDFKEKFEKASSGIIEQIDSLATIANEFSNFAKLPGTQLKNINLLEILNASMLIFENQKNIAIHNLIFETDIIVKGDKDQCLRVFNNLFKNAIQALDQTSNPIIELNCLDEGEMIVVSVTDNGCGIDESMKPKIFEPNFTTKTTGSGLGLAMVKNSIQGFGGKIWFESTVNKGTTFYIGFIKVQ